jgi:hypothetical protein
VANFLIPVAIGLASNLLLSLFAPKPPTQQKGKIEDTGVPTAEYGTSLSYPFGRVRKDSLTMFWALPLKEVKTKKRQEGKGGGGQTTEEFTYFMTCAFLIGREISSVRRIWLNSILVYGQGSGGKSQNFSIYTGKQTTVSSVIQGKESNPIPAFTGYSYIVFNNYPLADFEGSGFPRVDVEVIGESGENPKVKNVIRTICKIAKIEDSKIDISDIGDQTVEGFDLLFDGTTFADQIEEIMRTFFIVAREPKDKILFKRQESSSLTFVPRDSLGAKKFGEKPIDIDEKKLLHFREIPSAVVVSGKNVLNDYNDVSVTAIDPSAIHTNELSINTRLIATDNLFIDTASKILFLGRIQSKTYSKMFLLPAWDGLKVGDLIYTDSDQNVHKEILQITKKVRGSNYLIEIEAARYQGYVTLSEYTNSFTLVYYPSTSTTIQKTVSFQVTSSSSLRTETSLSVGQTSNSPNTYFNVYDQNDNLIFQQPTGYGITSSSVQTVETSTGTNTVTNDFIPVVTVNNSFTSTESPRPYGEAFAIPFEIPIVESRDTDIGLYVAIDGNPDFRTGGLFYSDNNGSSYSLATSVFGKSTIGTVLSFSSKFNNSSPHFIDTTNSIRIKMDSGELEPVTLESFLSGKQLGWFSTGEIIAFKNVTIVSSDPLTFDISYMIRGVKGTEFYIDKHTVGERFVLLTDYLIRLPIELYNINQQARVKIVPTGLSEPEIEEPIPYTIRLEGLKPFPASVRGQKTGNDLTISWYRRTRLNGRWTDYVDVPYANGELDSYTVRIYDGATVKREWVVTASRSVVYTESQQIADWGSIQSAYTVRVFQGSSYPVPFKESLATVV